MNMAERVRHFEADMTSKNDLVEFDGFSKWRTFAVLMAGSVRQLRKVAWSNSFGKERSYPLPSFHFQISWLRKNRHMNIITVGEHRFIQDERYSLPHYKGPSDWTLKIANVKLADGGIYECQIGKQKTNTWKISTGFGLFMGCFTYSTGTTPKTGRNISLFIAGKFNADSRHMCSPFVGP